MRLVAIAVYHFHAPLLPLVALHLERLRRHTGGDVPVYGGDARLAARERAWLAAQPGVTLFPAEETADPRAEHNLTLEALAARAFENGATHVLSLHLDSFPVADGWLDPMVAAIDAGAPFACIEPRSYNACLMWDRAWQDIGPRMLLTEAERASPEFAAFRTEHPTLNHADGGLGFLFAAWRAGRRWHALQPSAPTIWGDVLLHVEGTARGTVPRIVSDAHRRMAAPLVGLMPERLHSGAKLFGRRLFSRPAGIGEAGGATAVSKLNQARALVADPDGFIARCRATSLPADAARPAAQSVVDASLGKL